MHRLETRRAVDLAADQLRTEILADTWRPGEHLPSERELAVRLGPSRPTIRAALAKLEAEGLLRARHGSGVEVLDWRATAGVGVLPHLLAGADLRLVEPFLALRRAVAAEVVARVCVRATDAELDALALHADALARERDPDALAAGNLAFSRALVALADNLPMQLLTNTVTDVLAARPDLRRALEGDLDSVRKSFGAIVALLRTREPDTARDAVRRTLEALDATVLTRLDREVRWNA